jgi:hypothetical protein
MTRSPGSTVGVVVGVAVADVVGDAVDVGLVPCRIVS